MVLVIFIGCLVEDVGWCSVMLPRDRRVTRWGADDENVR